MRRQAVLVFTKACNKKHPALKTNR
jgi:hypothetical protein